ncbi:MAG: hypothetical protein Q4Q06_01525 [Bacteroidota bacterium]|nr:hypothetical protein [Bacteroidota bacterium]
MITFFMISVCKITLRILALKRIITDMLTKNTDIRFDLGNNLKIEIIKS